MYLSFISSLSGQWSGRDQKPVLRDRLVRRLPLLLLCSTSLTALAHAQEIDSTVTDPVLTSTFDNGTPGDVLITEDGAIESTTTDNFVAVTIDSNNSVTNEGEITIEDGNGTIGILMLPGFSGNVINSGSITVTETYEREDEDDDDDLDGPYAQGSNRFGILLQGGGLFTGNLITETGSTIEVIGNDSAAIALRSALLGDITIDGALTTIGDNAIALDVTGDVTGNILVSGSVTVKGENAAAINLSGNVDGSFIIESGVTSSGFDSVTTTNYVSPSDVDDDTPALEDRIDAEELLDNKATVVVSGSVSQGVLLNGGIDTFISEEDSEDETKDTADDFDENRGVAVITSYGSGPALLISAEEGDQSGDLIIGTVVEQVRDTLDDDEDDDTTELLAEFTFEQGLINRGTIVASGLNVGFDAIGMRIEGELTGTAQTIITGGILNSGTISARAYEADATAVSLGMNTDIGTFLNSGTITSTINTTDAHSAIAILVEEGVMMSSFTNSGSIVARSIGRTGEAVGIRDMGSTITEFTNNGTINAYHSVDGQDVTEVGDLVAIDLSAHDSATGVTIVQDYATPVDDINGDDEIDTDDVPSPFIIGDIWLGAGADSLSVLAGYVSGDVDFGSGNAELIIDDAGIDGDVFFADGTHTASLNGAIITGDLFFDDSTSSLSLTNGSEFYGHLIATNSLLSVSSVDSILYLESGNATDLTSLSVTGDSELIFEIDPDNTSAPVLTVSGSAAIGSDVIITPILTSLPDELTTQTLISAGSLDFDGDFNDLELSGIPWLYTTELTVTDSTIDTLDLTFTRKTAEELGLDVNETAAYDSLLELFEKDDELGAAISAITTEQEFNEFYDLLIPQRTDASTRYLEAQSNAAFGALDQALETASLTETGGIRYWAQEYFVGIEQDVQDQSPGYNGNGFGISLGVDKSLGSLDSIGFMIGFSSGEFEEKTGGKNPVTTTSFGGGAYVQDKLGPVDLRLAGLISRVGFDAHRDIEFSDSYFYNVDAEWNGWSAALSARASSQFDLGFFYVKPAVSVDWFKLSQDAYTETGGDDLLEADISSVDTDRLTASGLLAIGKDWKTTGGFFRAEVRGGYRSVMSSTPYEADVSYLGSDQTFTLAAPEDDTSATLFGASLITVGEITTFNFGYDMEVTDTGTTHFAGATVRIKF